MPNEGLDSKIAHFYFLLKNTVNRIYNKNKNFFENLIYSIKNKYLF